jgi:hypothetical protein
MLEWPSCSNTTFGVDASREEERGAGVPEIVEADSLDLGLGVQPHPSLTDLSPRALDSFSTGRVRFVVAFPFPSPRAAADQRTTVAAIDLAPKGFEAEADTVVGAGGSGIR